MKVALTGHRPQRLGLPEDEMDDRWDKIDTWIVKQPFQMYQVTYIENENLDVYCGMASGCDVAFGMIATIMKAGKFNFILHCVLPCKEYNSSNKYNSAIKEYADEWIELSDKWYKGCDNVRDQYIVDNCDILLAIWDGKKSGGVWSTIRKAQKAGKQIIYCPKEVLSGE